MDDRKRARKSKRPRDTLRSEKPWYLSKESKVAKATSHCCQSRLLEQQISVKIINTKSLIVCELWYQFPMFICTNCLEQITLAHTLFSLDFKFSTGNQNFLEWISSVLFRLENFGR